MGNAVAVVVTFNHQSTNTLKQPGPTDGMQRCRAQKSDILHSHHCAHAGEKGMMRGTRDFRASSSASRAWMRAACSADPGCDPASEQRVHPSPTPSDERAREEMGVRWVGRVGLGSLREPRPGLTGAHLHRRALALARSWSPGAAPQGRGLQRALHETREQLRALPLGCGTAMR